MRPQRSSRATQMHGAKAHCGPVVARLLGGDVLDVAHQRRVAGGAQADVVREDRRAVHVAVAVHGVDAVEDRDVQARGQRGPLVAVDHVRPRLGRVRGRHRAAAGQHAAELVAGDLRRVGVDVRALGLRHLADLLGERHARQQVVDALCDGQRSRPRRAASQLPWRSAARLRRRSAEGATSATATASSAAPRGRRADDPDRGMVTPPFGTENASRRPTPAVRSLRTGAPRRERVASRCLASGTPRRARETRRQRRLTLASSSRRRRGRRSRTRPRRTPGPRSPATRRTGPVDGGQRVLSALPARRTLV